MASFQVEWKSSALKELRRLPREVVPRIVAAVEALGENPYPGGARKLAGAHSTFRIREGVYRVIYTVLAHALIIEIVKVGHRKDIYR